jgi:hypothetical protein
MEIYSINDVLNIGVEKTLSEENDLNNLQIKSCLSEI